MQPSPSTAARSPSPCRGGLGIPLPIHNAIIYTPSMPVLLTDDQIAATRARIVDIAMRHAVERGVDGVSMHGVARELGWTATALYRYFDGKDALLTAARVAGLNDLSERLEAVMAGPGDVWDKSRASGAARACRRPSPAARPSRR